MLGAGFPDDTISRGIALGADVIAVDGGSTDSGPYYLGASQPKTARAAVLRDMRAILIGAAAADIPVIVGSCGTSGTDDGVEWLHSITRQVIDEEHLTGRKIARIYSEVDKALIRKRLADKRIHNLPPAGHLTDETIDSCEHIVGLMGHEPIADALAHGANIVLAGRSTDCALIAAVPLMRGKPFGPTWHASKIAECGSLCTTGSGIGGVMVHIDDDGFVVEPVDADDACTPRSVAAHMLYENSDPFRLREPAGTLDTTDAHYTALDDRRVRVTGSRFEYAEAHTIKLEGSAVAGAQTVSIVGLRDPQVLAGIGDWIDSLATFLHARIPTLFDVGHGDYTIELRPYGWNAVLGDIDPDPSTPREVGVACCVTARDQSTATAIAKFANPYLLHHALPGTDSVPSWSFMSSPAEMERGNLYTFVLQHSMEVDTPTELFPIDYSEELR
ncbi:acyclic terpene utilization AtuA family protein [Rhodococcus sp. 1R11]|nr:acyclic terpene utilization AtuA family protein [Rhodococcus sp. 1R11]